MAPDDSKQALGRDMLLASVMVAAGLTIAGLAQVQLSTPSPLMAQATQPLQSSSPVPRDDAPAESKPGGARPTTPAP